MQVYGPGCAVVSSLLEWFTSGANTSDKRICVATGYDTALEESMGAHHDLVVLWAGDERLRDLATGKNPTRYYALDSDPTGEPHPVWSAALVHPNAGAHPFDLFVGGTSGGRVDSPMFGSANARYVLAALAAATEGYGIALDAAIRALGRFRGAPGHQELVGNIAGVHVYREYYDESLAALRLKHPKATFRIAGDALDVSKVNENDCIVFTEPNEEQEDNILSQLMHRYGG